jgi:hypothetical protein
MKIAAIVSVHDKQDVSLDTLNSVSYHMTDKVLLLVDGEYWNMWRSIDLPAHKLCGFNHGSLKSPYRNILLGLMSAYKYWGNEVDWFTYIEYDCLIGSAGFKKELIETDGIWCLGSSFRKNQTMNLSFVEKMINGKFEEIVYLVSACMFYHKSFLQKMLESGFFDKFLFYTNEFKKGYLPFYDGFDLTGHLLPTMVKYFGGGIKELSFYSEEMNVWGGNYRRYPIRYRPEINNIEPFLNSSIIHPIKEINHPLRIYYREKREKYAEENSYTQL